MKKIIWLSILTFVMSSVQCFSFPSCSHVAQQESKYNDLKRRVDRVWAGISPVVVRTYLQDMENDIAKLKLGQDCERNRSAFYNHAGITERRITIDEQHNVIRR